MYFKIVLY